MWNATFLCGQSEMSGMLVKLAPGSEPYRSGSCCSIMLSVSSVAYCDATAMALDVMASLALPAGLFRIFPLGFFRCFS